LSFQKNVKNTLGLYRKEKLGIEKPGFYKYRGQNLLKEHILPTEFKAYNIIQYYRDSFFSSLSSQIKFHKYFHHLNSSQALCINFFFPLMLDDKLDLILDLLQIPKRTITGAHFEKESDLETNAGRRTNFDFFMQLSDNTKIYFEIKYSEAEFGKAKNDNEHRVKYTNTYHPLLKNNSFIKPEYVDIDKFLDSYQIMRNLCHINDKSYIVFVFPKENQNIHLQTQSAQKKILTDKGRDKFKILLLEAAVDEILRQVQSTKLQEHYREFQIKYLN
jgi:hypothetical protein